MRTKVSAPGERAAATRRFRSAWPLIAATWALLDHPGRMIRNPCGEPATCPHPYCYGPPGEAETVRRTGLPSDRQG